jgi:hypothetical protein
MPPIFRQSQFLGKVFSSISSSSLCKYFAISLKELVCWPSLSRGDELFSVFMFLLIMLLLLLMFSKDLFKVVKIVSSVWVSFSRVLSESKTDERFFDFFSVWISSFSAKKAFFCVLFMLFILGFVEKLSLRFLRRFCFAKLFAAAFIKLNLFKFTFFVSSKQSN